MAGSLNVIALISGGKDSFFSLLHCLRNNHRIIALANLYPPSSTSTSDLNSFMYQTVGHTVIPLYSKALDLPLYRQEIRGGAVHSGLHYAASSVATLDEEEDETESLIPLLRRVMKAHPEANALCTGAILSTYQRTRVESVAGRLGLIPLSYLWKYPVLPPGRQVSLLEDMETVGLEARIVKVASGGLDENFLWEDVVSRNGRQSVERAMRRFGCEGDGAVIGEGGEFETLVLDGPDSLFKSRIVVDEKDRVVVREGGGSAWLSISGARLEKKTLAGTEPSNCRVPEVFEDRFSKLFEEVSTRQVDSPIPDLSGSLSSNLPGMTTGTQPNIIYRTIQIQNHQKCRNIAEETQQLIHDIRALLASLNLMPTAIISTIILLRSMSDFSTVNSIYSTLFSTPNPPARVTIACGTLLASPTNLMIHLKLSLQSSSTSLIGLHVQSRSYWAPANIGPYSQAISTQCPSSNVWTTDIAGQIPLIPASMRLPDATGNGTEDFSCQATLALQHLWRIGAEMDVQWWTSAVFYLAGSSAVSLESRVAIAARLWKATHRLPLEQDEPDSADEERDLWEEKHFSSKMTLGEDREQKKLPDWSLINGSQSIPPCFGVEVEGLPRDSAIEWHAHLGLGSVSIRLSTNSTAPHWTIHQTMFGDRRHVVISFPIFPDPTLFLGYFKTAVESLGAEAGKGIVLSYIDASLLPSIRNQDLQLGTIVPCRSIWAVDRIEQLLGVVLLDLSS